MTFSTDGLPAGVTQDFLNSAAGKALDAQYQLNAMGTYYDDQIKKQQSGRAGGGSGDPGGGLGGVSGGTGSSFGLSDFTSASRSATDLAKDMAQFQLGINDQQSAQDLKYREQEAQSNYGRTSALQSQTFGENTQLKQQDFRNTYALQGQQNQANLGLDAQRNTAAMQQLTKQTDTQKEMQSADFTNQSTQRAQQAALAQLGFRR